MIGSTLAHRLVDFGANVAIMDARLEPYGANDFNVASIKSDVTVVTADIRDRDALAELIPGKDIVFNLAGQVSHNDSMDDPFLDADINYIGHLAVAETLRQLNPTAVVIHSGSRLQYGRIETTPVNESHPVRPRTPYGLNKRAAESMYLFYNTVHHIPCVLFRIANPYGPRSQMKHNKYSMVNWFIRQAMEGKPLTIFGDGEQIRDYIYVDDIVDAMLHATATPACYGEIFNIGSGIGAPFREMCEEIVKHIPDGRLEFVPWPNDYINVETGHYISDNSKLFGRTGWTASTSLSNGIEKTVRYYLAHREHYWR